MKHGPAFKCKDWGDFYCPDCGKKMEAKDCNYYCNKHGGWCVVPETDEKGITNPKRVKV